MHANNNVDAARHYVHSAATIHVQFVSLAATAMNTNYVTGHAILPTASPVRRCGKRRFTVWQ